MNRQGPGKIDYCDYTWTPITGCLHGCSYCYVQRIANRFKSRNMMEPAFHPEKLREPLRVKAPSVIFVSSTGDAFGDWVPREWIEAVFDAMEAAPWHTYLLLTKNPVRYSQFYSRTTRNIWWGTSVDGKDNTKENLLLLVAHALITKAADNLFVSFEPLLSGIAHNANIVSLAQINWFIIGADSTKGAKKPPRLWAGELVSSAKRRDAPVWIKDNYGYPERVKERPF